MKFVFECAIESDERFVIADLLKHISNCVEDEGNYHGGYDWCCADYSWSITENDESDDSNKE